MSKAQSTLEYALLLAAAVMAAVMMFSRVRSAIYSGLKIAELQINMTGTKGSNTYNKDASRVTVTINEVPAI